MEIVGAAAQGGALPRGSGWACGVGRPAAQWSPWASSQASS